MLRDMTENENLGRPVEWPRPAQPHRGGWGARSGGGGWRASGEKAIFNQICPVNMEGKW